jgi:glycosyltransferase involved in cell wall biosynthesis
MTNKGQKPKFSIVIPIYKRRNLAVETIKSVLKQEEINQDSVEIIVVDDEDGTKKSDRNKIFYKSIARNIRYLRNKFDEGPGGARQTGLKVAKGKFLIFLDSDDRLKPKFIFEMSRSLKKGKGLVAGICLSSSVFEKGFSKMEKIKLTPLISVRNAILIFSYFFNGKIIFPGSFYLCQVSHMMFRTRLIKNMKFNYDYRRGGEDWDFISQSLGEGDIKIIPQRLLYFRYSPSSLINLKINRQMKWKSYLLLSRRLKTNLKRGLFYRLFLMYIYLFGDNYAKK